MFTRKLKILFYTVGTVIIFLFMMIGNVSHTTAQQVYFWSQQEKISEYYQYTDEPPYLIADQNHTVHAFNSQPLDLRNPNSQKAIFYRQWIIESGWTFPTDILFDTSGSNMDLVGVTTDQMGRVYLVFQLKSEEIYYTWAFLTNAGNPASWSPPLLLATKSLNTRPGIRNTASIATDAGGDTMVVIYSGLQDGNGLYFTSSMDGGSTWADPYPLYLTGDEVIVVTDPKLYVDEAGIFHAVWSTFLKSGAGGLGYYANFTPGINTWSQPLELDAPGIRTPSVFEYQGEVFVSYHHINANGNWWRRSSDRGKTWTSPAQISSRHVGTNGAVSFVVDSLETLHVFFAQRIDDNNHGVWQSIWTGTAWTNPESVVRGPRKIDVIGGDGFDPNSVRAIISNGNVLFVSWGTDGGAGSNGAWYSYKRLDSPELQAVPLPAPIITMQSDSTEEILPMVTATVGAATKPSDILSSTDDSHPSSWNPQSIILIGVIPVLLLLAGIILLRYTSHSRNT